MCFVGRSIYKHMITENTMITEKQNSSSLLVSWFWEPLELLCEHCASVSWKRASSSDCLPELFGKSITESVPHSSQLWDPDVFVLCCLYANTCMSLKIFVLFRGCGREKILCSFIFSILMHLDVFSMTVSRKTFLLVRVLFCFCVCTGIGLQSFHPSAVFQYSLCSASALSIQGRRNSVCRERIVYFPSVWNSAV